MTPLIQLKKVSVIVLGALVLGCFGLLPHVHAVSPPPDGGYPGSNTAEGQNALFSLTTGFLNTAVGWAALHNNTTADFNTALGAAALFSNTTGDKNTAVGTGALALNNGDGNTAVGFTALLLNITGKGNTAVGAGVLLHNTGDLNVAVGTLALTRNTAGSFNIAIGGGQPADPELPPALAALGSNTTGNANTAVGAGSVNDTAALGKNTTGAFNTAIGNSALNGNTTGSFNIAVGADAGSKLTTGKDNIDIGNDGVAEESNTIRIGTPFQPSPTPASGQNRTFIAGIYGQPPGANTLPVVCADDGKLTANASSRRFKHDIKPMDNASEAILALKPVSFRYNNDSTDTPWFGLIAEDVAEINPDLIARDKEGKPFGVRYDQVNMMLLNEFLKEHRKNEDQEATIARLEKQIEALTAGLQKVSAQLEVSKAAPQTVAENP